jgi:hypothetical protein
MKRLLLVAVASVALLVPLVASPVAADTGPVPTQIACTAFAPHGSGDHYSSGSYRTVTRGYRCSWTHIANPSTIHYAMVCHDVFGSTWWWNPGLDNWLAWDCTV